VRVDGYRSSLTADLPRIPATSPDFGDTSIGAADVTVPTDFRVAYPTGGNNNRFTDRIKAAVTLAIANPDSLFITVGGGLGGWDDHDNSLNKYTNRMNDLMTALRAAVKHIKYADSSDPSNPDGVRDTRNIIINVHGDFGRNVNLNGSMGWDHGNNQNLYTFGGSTVRAGGAAALGKIVGTTERFGTSGQNRQFTRPISGGDQFEPMSIAATVYSYFGIQNPEVLTRDVVINPDGDTAIDETVATAALNPYTP